MPTKVNIACIIDDDPIYVFGTKRLMQMANFCESFLIYSNGKEALDKLNIIIKNGDAQPDVIFLDINMPVMDGWDFLEEFTKTPSSKSIIIYIVTSSIDPMDVNKAKKYQEVSNYIIKPVTYDKITDLMNNFN